ncbi:MAG: PH domain-containing protein [Pseudomonadota bacterium]
MAGYVEQTLASNEEIIYRANFNWTYSFFPVLWCVIGLAPLILYALLQFASGVDFAELRVGWAFAAGAALVGLLILLFHLIVLWTTEIVVTTYRFVYKRGLIARNTQEVSLNKIEEITLNQSIWGRFFGYGELVMRGTGVGVIKLPAVDNPIQVRRIIENARSKLRDDGGSKFKEPGGQINVDPALR